MPIKLKYLACVTVALIPPLFAVGGTASAADEVFKPTTAIALPPGSQPLKSFDISYVDPVLGVYVLADRSNKAIELVDTQNLTITQLHGTVPFVGFTGSNDTSGPDGVLIVRHREIWAGDGNSTVKVLDLFTGVTTHVIATGLPSDNRADEMCWDPRDRQVMVANNAATPPFASIISTDTYTVLKRITFDGTNGAPNSNNGIEQCQWSPRTGKFYITVPGIAGHPPGEGGVAVIDPVSKSVVATFIIPLAACSTPQGAAVGPDHQLGIGCNGTNAIASSVIIDERNGHVIAAVPNEAGPDEIWYNPGDGHYFLARSGGPAPTQVLGVIDAENPGGPKADPDAFTAFKGVPGGGNAHSVAADPTFNQVFVPIPAGSSTVCSTTPGTPTGGPATDAIGCIAVYTTPNDDPRPRLMAERDHDRDHDRDRGRDRH